MARILSLEAGKPVSRNRIKRIMKEEDLQSRQRRRRFSEEVYIRRREMRDNAPRDLLNRNFHSCEPMRILVEDITYLPTISGFRYLNSIVDLYNGEIVAYRISEHVNAELSVSAPLMIFMTSTVPGFKERSCTAMPAPHTCHTSTGKHSLTMACYRAWGKN